MRLAECYLDADDGGGEEGLVVRELHPEDRLGRAVGKRQQVRAPDVVRPVELRHLYVGLGLGLGVGLVPRM